MNNIKEKGFIPLILLPIILIGLVLVYGLYWYLGSILHSPESQPTACTLEAKVCPDGTTSVGRSGPNCEFAACPTSKNIDEVVKLKTFTNMSGYSFQYPIQDFLSNNIGDNEAQTNSPIVYIYSNKPSINNSYKAYFIVITKNLPSGYYNAMEFDSFTYNINKIMSARVGDKVLFSNGDSTLRKLDEQLNGINFKVFEFSGEKRYVFENTKYIYIIGVHNNNSEETDILSTLKFTN